MTINTKTTIIFEIPKEYEAAVRFEKADDKYIKSMDTLTIYFQKTETQLITIEQAQT